MPVQPPSMLTSSSPSPSPLPLPPPPLSQPSSSTLTLAPSLPSSAVGFGQGDSGGEVLLLIAAVFSLCVVRAQLAVLAMPPKSSALPESQRNFGGSRQARARGALGLNRAPASRVQARKSREHVQLAALPAAIRLSGLLLGLLGRARHSMDAATRLDPERLSTGHEHATQTARIGSGRVVPVRQRHGLLSLTLVARKGGKPEPSFEATVLHRSF